MKILCSAILILIFGYIALMHFYWAFGGQHGKMKAVPIDEKGNYLFHPSALSCYVVGLFFMLLIFLILQLNLNVFPQLIDNYIVWLIALMFLLRSIGDFKYVGIFKKIKKTEFAKRDKRYFTPLCIVIMILDLSIYLFK